MLLETTQIRSQPCARAASLNDYVERVIVDSCARHTSRAHTAYLLLKESYGVQPLQVPVNLISPDPHQIDKLRVRLPYETLLEDACDYLYSVPPFPAMFPYGFTEPLVFGASTDGLHLRGEL